MLFNWNKIIISIVVVGIGIYIVYCEDFGVYWYKWNDLELLGKV